MEILFVLLVLVVIWFLIAPIVAMVRATDAKAEAKQTRADLTDALARIKLLENEISRAKSVPSPPTATIPPRRDAARGEIPKPPANPTLEAVIERGSILARRDEVAMEITPPPLPEPAKRRKLIDYGDDASPQKELPNVEPPAPKEPFSLEQFMGAKLFAWLGGVAMFFGVIFFVKYAFENNLIPPYMRIILGFVTGTGLLAGGLVTHRLPRYRVLAQAFCATGVLTLYGVSFAAHGVYHFPLFGTVQTFTLMAGITFAAFLIAVRLDALVVAVLGMLGGFMTPLLLSTGQDQVLGLFGYIALLDAGLLAVSRHGKWRFLTPCAAAGTVLMQVGWYGKFFTSGRYYEGNLILIPMGILLGFIVLFLLGGWIKQTRPTLQTAGSVLGLSAVAMLFSFVLLGRESVAGRNFLLYGFVLLVHLGVMATVRSRPSLGIAQLVTALLGFIHLACWTNWYLTTENLSGALTIYLIFGALHAGIPVLLSRYQPDRLAVIPQKSGPWFAPLLLVMMALPIFYLEPVPMLIWAAILMADLLVIALAFATGAIIPVLASLALTMGVAAIWLFKGPSEIDSLTPFLGVITGFSALFAVAGKWLSRGADEQDSSMRFLSSNLTVASGVLPFALLIMAILRLPVTVPTPVFGVALLMSAFLATLAITGKQGKLLLVALLGTLSVEGVWFLHHFDKFSPNIALIWFLGFYALFFMLPFALRKRCADLPEIWIASALAGVLHFPLVHSLMKQSFPNPYMGLIPAAFAVPSLLGLFGVLKFFQGMDRVQQSRLAWFGGVSLLFITLIFPIQFERQWITVSWAIEGALLLLLFRRVPHVGLQLTGLALLAISFIRLAANPAVFTAYPRSGTAILNWHLYAYGLVAASQFLGAKWFTDPLGRLEQIKPRGVLLSLGGILLFLLLNIEIADYFTAPDDSFITFRFGGNFARDMTYSIAWGLFSLGLLGIGFWSHSKHARFAAVGLLIITLIKVFIHDLANIQNVFRVGALVGVAVIAFIASFLYQRFFDRPEN